MSFDAHQMLAAVATLYGVAGALSILLQARQMLTRGASRDVSLQFLTTYVGGYAIWLVYGVSIQSVPIILVHALGLVCGSTTLTVAVRLRGSPRTQPTTTRSPKTRPGCAGGFRR